RLLMSSSTARGPTLPPPHLPAVRRSRAPTPGDAATLPDSPVWSPYMTVGKPFEIAATTASVTVPAALLRLCALHTGWAVASPWPAATRRELAARVFTQAATGKLDGGMPPAAATWAVAGALAGMAGAVAAAGAGVCSRRLRRATWAIAAVFGARS